MGLCTASMHARHTSCKQGAASVGAATPRMHPLAPSSRPGGLAQQPARPRRKWHLPPTGAVPAAAAAASASSISSNVAPGPSPSRQGSPSEPALPPQTCLRHLEHIASASQLATQVATQTQEPLPQLEDVELALAQLHGDRARPQELMQAAVLLGSIPGSSSALLLKLCEGCKGRLGECPAPLLASLLPVLVLRGLRPEALIADVMHELQAQLSELPPGQQVAVLASLVRLGVRPTSAWLAAWEDSTRTAHQGLSCAELSEAAWAVGEARWAPGAAWTSGLLVASQYRLHLATPAQLAQLMAGLGQAAGAWQALGQPWRDAALRATLTCLQAEAGAGAVEVEAADLARLLRGAAALGLRPGAQWLAAAGARARAALPECSARDLMDVVDALCALSEVHAEAPATSSSAAAVAPRQAKRREGKGGGGSNSQEGAAVIARVRSWVPAAAANGSPQPSDAAAHQTPTAPSSPAQPAAGPPAAPTQPPAPDAAGPPAPWAAHLEEEQNGPRALCPTLLGAWCTRAWRATLLRESGRRLAQLPASSLVRLLAALVRLRARPPPDWLRQHAAVLLGKLDAVPHDELAALPAALLALRGAPGGELAAALQAASASKLSLVGDGALVGMARALEGLRRREGRARAAPLDARWCKAFLHETGARVAQGRLRCAHACELPALAVRLGLRPPAQWWAAVLEETRRCAEQGRMDAPAAAGLNDGASGEEGARRLEVDDRGLADLLWGVGVSGVVPSRAWVDAVMGVAKRRARAAA